MDEAKLQRYETLLGSWLSRVGRNSHVHFACADHYSRLHYYLGVPAVVLSGAVGTAVFVSIESEATGNLKVAAGLVSFLAAILAGLQTFLAFSERAEKHRMTSSQYAAIRRRIEYLLTILPEAGGDVEVEIDMVRKDMDAVATAAPEPPNKIRAKIQKDLDGGLLKDSK